MSNTKTKVSAIVPVGSSVEEGTIMFWAFDSSCSRTFVVPESTRVDIVLDMLLDFLGKELTDEICLKPIVVSRRADKIIAYINGQLAVNKITAEV